MVAKIISKNEFIFIRPGIRVTFYKKPIEYRNSFRNLTEFKKYRVIGKYYKSPYGALLETLTILDDYNKPQRLHRSFFLTNNLS